MKKGKSGFHFVLVRTKAGLILKQGKNGSNFVLVRIKAGLIFY